MAERRPDEARVSEVIARAESLAGELKSTVSELVEILRNYQSKESS